MDEISKISAISVSSLPIPTHSVSVRFPPSPWSWKSKVVHNVPEASDTNRFANLGRSKTSTEYHRITCFGGRK